MVTSTLPALAQDAAADRAKSTAPQARPPHQFAFVPEVYHQPSNTNTQLQTRKRGPARVILASIRPMNALMLWCDSVWCSELARTRIMSRRNHAEFGARVHSLCAGVLRGPCPASFLAGGEGYRAYRHKNYRTREFFDRFIAQFIVRIAVHSAIDSILQVAGARSCRAIDRAFKIAQPWKFARLTQPVQRALPSQRVSPSPMPTADVVCALLPGSGTSSAHGLRRVTSRVRRVGQSSVRHRCL